jgi:quinone-modifying oxidoreductase subunit QmoB
MEKKIGVYICSGCGIGEAINVEQLGSVASENNVPVCRSHNVLCSKDGVQVIKNDIEQEGVNTIVIAACSPRVMYDVFSFDGCIVDRVNLREQVAWCQPPGDENTQMMAEDYLRMGLAKVNRMELPEPYKPDTEMSKDILVVGGGVSGLSAALAAADAGYKVTLVEKSAELGGFQKKVKNIATFPYKRGLQSNPVGDLVQKVQNNENITVYTEARIESTAGGPGLFDVTISQNGSSVTHRFGAIVLATG